MPKEIVITGFGVVAPNAIGAKAFLQALQDGVSGIDEIRAFDTSDYDVHRGGEVKGLDRLGAALDSTGCLGRTSQLAMAAVREAIDHAGLSVAACDPARVGVILGTTSGEVRSIETVHEAWAVDQPARPAPAFYRELSSNVITSLVSSTFGFAGPTMMLANACSSGNFAIGLGCDLIREEEADVILAGGADSFWKGTLAGFSRLHAVAPAMCQPFDRDRKGMMVSEGAAVVVLEERERARRRGATIHAVVLGSGMSCDAFHPTAPDPAGLANAMRLALDDAGVTPSEMQYINAHGTGTAANDAAETEAIKAVFGENAARIPVSSIKSMIGHTMGAASAIETVACCLALVHGFLPPTINYQVPDPACDLDYVPNRARVLRLDVLMNNSFAFGGNNACLVLGRA
jgi:3-oxoacyl-[acyl-carrier-protein] synthase II